jgi:hypothetical protein
MIRTSDDGVQYCRQTGCLISKQAQPATVLLRTRIHPTGLPACEACARFQFEMFSPGDVELAPLGEYVDLFAEAKQAMNATPGQVIRGEPASLRQTWDTGEPVITPVATLAPARAGNGFTAEERAARTGRQGAKLSKRAWRGLGIFTLGSLLLGIVMVAAGTAHGNNGFSGQGSTSGSPLAQHLGIALIVLPIVAWVFVLLLTTISEGAKEAQRYKAWKATLSPQQQRELWLAETAAMAAGAYAVHHHVKASRARGAAAFQARSAAYQAEHAQRQQDQMAADLRSLASGGGQQFPVVPGPTRRSDIHGNLI